MATRGDVLELLHGAHRRWSTLSVRACSSRSTGGAAAEVRWYDVVTDAPNRHLVEVRAARDGDVVEVHGRDGTERWVWSVGGGYRDVDRIWPGPVPDMVDPAALLERFRLDHDVLETTALDRPAFAVTARTHERRAARRTGAGEHRETWTVDAGLGILLRRSMATDAHDLLYELTQIEVDGTVDVPRRAPDDLRADVREEPEAASWLEVSVSEAAASLPYPLLLPTSMPHGSHRTIRLLGTDPPRVSVRYALPPGPAAFVDVALHAAAAVADLDEQRLPWRRILEAPVAVEVRAGRPRGSMPTLQVRAEVGDVVAFLRGDLPVEHLVGVASSLVPVQP